MLDPSKVRLPAPESFAVDDILRPVCKVLGIALVVQWFLPWLQVFHRVIHSWDLMQGGSVFPMLWSLVGGIALAAVGFAPRELLRSGHVAVAAAGVGVVGLLSMGPLSGTNVPMVPQVGLLGLLWVFGSMLSFLLWRYERGETARLVLMGSLGAAVLWLFVPLDGRLPLLYMFQVFGLSDINILWRLVGFAGVLGALGLMALSAVFALLPGRQAEDAWIRLLFWLHALYLPLLLVLAGLTAMLTTPWFLVWNLHILVITTAFLTPAVLGGFIVARALLWGQVRDLFD